MAHAAHPVGTEQQIRSAKRTMSAWLGFFGLLTCHLAAGVCVGECVYTSVCVFGRDPS